MHFFPPNLTAPAWDLASAAPSLSRMADACGLPATLRAARGFASPCPSKPRHENDAARSGDRKPATLPLHQKSTPLQYSCTLILGVRPGSSPSPLDSSC